MGNKPYDEVMSNATTLEKNILLLQNHIEDIRSAWRIVGDIVEPVAERKLVLKTLNTALDMAQSHLSEAISMAGL